MPSVSLTSKGFATNLRWVKWCCCELRIVVTFVKARSLPSLFPARAKNDWAIAFPPISWDSLKKMVVTSVENRRGNWQAVIVVSNTIPTNNLCNEAEKPSSCFTSPCGSTQIIELQICNPFESLARNAIDGRFTLRLDQVMVSEHESVTALIPNCAPGARRGSLEPAATRRRASSGHAPFPASKPVASTTCVGEGLEKSKQETTARKTNEGVGVEGVEAPAEMKVSEIFSVVRFTNLIGERRKTVNVFSKPRYA